MPMRRLVKTLPAVLCLSASVVVMIVGARSDNQMNYAIIAILLAVVGLILSMSLQSSKYYQEQLHANRQRKRKEKKTDGLFGEDEYNLFGKTTKQNQKGSLDDLGDDEINKL